MSLRACAGFLLVAALCTSGCGTIGDLIGDRPWVLGSSGPHVLGGVRIDIHDIGHPSWFAVFHPWIYILDLPFSLAVDGVLLPFTLVYQIVSPESGRSRMGKPEGLRPGR
jgi:uncharacterized protein YceK